MKNPMGPLYSGGIIKNSEFNSDLMGWSVPWGVEATVISSPSGNKFAASRSKGGQPSHSILPGDPDAEQHPLHALSIESAMQMHASEVFFSWRASLCVYSMVAGVKRHGGREGCWTMLKGGMTAYFFRDSRALLRGKTNWHTYAAAISISPQAAAAAVDILLDSVSLQPFSADEWNAQRKFSADRARKSSVRVVAQLAADGKPLANATLGIKLARPAFPLGNAMTKEIPDAMVGVGLERATLDVLGQMGISIWLTELDVAGGPRQAAYLEEVLREGYGHPSVEGILMWAAWHAKGCYVMCLTDDSFKNLAAGDVVDGLIAEWNTHPKEATTDANGGVVRLGLVDGQYNLTLTHPLLKAPAVHAVTVDASSSKLEERVLYIKA
ncbi:hypothetical protein U9M48_009169 [Paspalum notatum var. saurae]|uniref:Uncharacterized protein n=1 Tax=Paspalum notatum var. saurae TaxID=547442 RepID=A0AAQ3SR17_PASNO